MTPPTANFLHFRRAELLDPRLVVVRLVFGALPDGFGEDLVEAGSEVEAVPEQVLVWLSAGSGGWVSLEAVLARGGLVGAKVALPLTPDSTIALNMGGGGDKIVKRRRTRQI